MEHDELEKNYNTLFPDDATKAAAFDKIAKRYYFANFGSMSKSDVDLLMFSLYADELYGLSSNDSSKKSNYAISKQLGITEGKINGLKIKKQLIYPYAGFDWKDEFANAAKNATFDDNKIKLQIRDPNVYIEVQNAIETKGGYIEKQLTPNLLQIEWRYFLDLLLLIAPDQSRESLKKAFIQSIRAKEETFKWEDDQSFGKALISETPEMILGVVEEAIPLVGKAVGKIIRGIVNAAISARNRNR